MTPALVAAWSQPVAVVALVLVYRQAAFASLIVLLFVGPLVVLVFGWLFIFCAVAIADHDPGSYLVVGLAYGFELGIWLWIPGTQHLSTAFQIGVTSYLSLLVAVVLLELVWVASAGMSIPRRNHGS